MLNKLEHCGVLAIVRSTRSLNWLRLAEALQDGGVRCLEITLPTPGALDGIAQIRSRFPGLGIGAGTVLGPADVRDAVNAGAEFVVTPVFDPATVDACNRAGVAAVCGCYSPTEMIEAQRCGAAYIKVFPAHRFGASACERILRELPWLKVFPTGGVSRENAREFIAAGCCGVAVGSNLIDPSLALKNEWNEITDRAAAFMAAIRSC